MDCFKKEEVPPEQTEYEKTYTERELLVIQRKFAEQAIRRYQDRIVKIEVPYCLELEEEIKIYEKILRKSEIKWKEQN